MFLDSQSAPFVTTALNARALRQDMIAGNIANVATPGYKSRDVDFESQLTQATRKGSDHTLALAKTHASHIDPDQSLQAPSAKVFFRDGHLARNDGNTVDIDVETSELSKNSVVYNALLAAYKKDTGITANVIDSSGRLQ